MSTKLIVSATDTQNEGLIVRVETHYNGHMESYFTESISYEELFRNWMIPRDFHYALFWKYVLDHQIDASLEREDFDFEINYFDPCMQP